MVNAANAVSRLMGSGNSVVPLMQFAEHGLVLAMLIHLILGVRKIQRTEHRKQMTACDELSRVEDKERTFSAFCHLTSVICYLTPEH